MNHEKIRQLRERRGLTQEEAAQLAGLSGRQGWNAIERGRVKNLTVETLERVASALGVKPATLLK